jgi:ABC-type nitrate/sulfonate/bicarbonate transport system substrate-binding protein
MITRRTLIGAVGASAMVGVRARAATAPAVVDAATLQPPSNTSYLLPLIKDQELEKKFALDFRPKLYTDTGALYADFAAGKLPSMISGLYNAANFRVRGVPVKVLFTLVTANHAIVSKDPKIRQAEDLKDKTIAATTSSGQWGMVVLFLKTFGLDARRNINVLNASPPAVQTQLLAGKVDAGVLWDPALSNMLTSGYHLVGDMNGTVRKALGMASDAPVWFLGTYAREPWIAEDADRNRRYLEMFQAAVEFYYRQPERADRVISAFTKVPVEALKFSRDHHFAEFRIVPAVREKANLHKTFECFKAAGFLTAIPGDELYYPWPGLKA